ncbi:hypothetical protein TWF696_006891 [Orbilia brochopaga]|uniref:Uncharacterized protein n=1 Tax=Orbilia brochopaga TaxID=3140254 RepID=A0AAV9UQ76_9PEZI
MSDQSTQPLLQSTPEYDEKSQAWEPAASEKDPEKMLEAGMQDLDKVLEPQNKATAPKLWDADLSLGFRILKSIILLFFFGAIGATFMLGFGPDATLGATNWIWLLCCNGLSAAVVVWRLMVAFRNPAQFFGDPRQVVILVIYSGVVVMTIKDTFVMPLLNGSTLWGIDVGSMYLNTVANYWW